MSKRILLFIGWFSVSLFCLSACTRVPVPEAPRYQAGDTATVVRMHVLHTVDMGVLPLIKVRLGQETGWWLIDTGSSHNLIAPALAQKLQLKVVSGSNIATIGGYKSSTHHELSTLQIGNLKLAGQSASVVDLSGLSATDAYTVSGVLGMPALRNLVLALDYRNRTVRLANTRLPVNAKHQTSLAFNMESGVPVARLKFGNNRQGNLILDTGNATALVLMPSLRLLEQEKPLHFVEVADLGGTIPTQLASLDKLVLGNRDLKRVPVSLPLNSNHPQNIDGSLGNAILSLQDVVFDFPRQQLWLGRYAKPTVTLPGSFGFMLAQDNIISVVNTNSPADTAGLRRGDKIVAVGKIDTSAASSHTIWKLLSQRRNARLFVQRNTQRLNIYLQRRHYLPTL